MKLRVSGLVGPPQEGADIWPGKSLQGLELPSFGVLMHGGGSRVWRNPGIVGSGLHDGFQRPPKPWGRDCGSLRA